MVAGLEEEGLRREIDPGLDIAHTRTGLAVQGEAALAGIHTKGQNHVRGHSL